MTYIDIAEQLTGYKVRRLTRDRFTVVGYTLAIEPGDDDAIPAFWDDDPYGMMEELGYQLNASGYDVGLHFDVYPPGPLDVEAPMEFHITVVPVEDD